MLKKQPKNARGVIDNEVETKRKNGLYSLLMMLVGALIALMVGVFFYLSPFFNDSSPPLNQAVEVVPLPEETASEVTEYQFYEVLPEQEFRSVPEEVSVQAEKPEKVVSLKVDTTVKAEVPPPAEVDEITVVEEDATYDEPEPSISISTGAGTGTTYILQVRSYELANDADLKRAEVMMAGIDAQVLKRDDGTGNTIYQVVSLPMQTRDEAMSAYRRLQSNGIDSVVVEQKR
ncbi:MAG: SPOR domain-containing protein [Moraxella sp.]|nr:SPOR domain-containing protein [Moraxella sp.]